MKRILSLLVVLAMVIAMVPSVFAAKTEIDMDELLGIMEELKSIDEIEVALKEGAAKKIYKWIPEKNGVLSLAVELPEGAEMDITVSQGDNSVVYSELAEDAAFELAVVAGEEVTILITKSSEAAVETTIAGKFLAENNTEAEAIMVNFEWNEDQTVATATVTAEPGVTYFGQYRIGGMELTINDGEAFIIEDKGRMYPSTFTIVNEGKEAAEYVLKLTFPTGSQMNPEVLEELTWYMGELSLEEGNVEGYYYTYTAPSDGDLVFYFNEVTEGVEADIVVTSMKTYAQKTLLADGVDNYGLELQLKVSEGEELIIQMVVVPGTEGIPAADLNWTGNFTYPEGTEQNPIQIEWLWNEDWTAATAEVTVPAGQTLYYAGITNMLLSINGGEAAMMQESFVLTNEGAEAATYALSISFPVGAYENPAQLVIGENTATMTEGSQGYHYTWTAEANGNLTITMPEGNWFYVIDNMTTYVYGEWNYSDADPAVPSTTVSVKEGDVISVQVNTYDPEKPWNAPAGTITFTAAFEEVQYTPGNLDGNDEINEDDAIYLLMYALTEDAEAFPIDQPVDYDKNGVINEDDAIYLLMYALTGDDEAFPLV